jgi:hypothetical protein
MIINWDALISACITGSVVGVVTSITNWLLNRQLLRRLEEFEDSRIKKSDKERKDMTQNA